MTPAGRMASILDHVDSRECSKAKGGKGMQKGFAIDALAALADPIRLELYRLLVRRGPLGTSAENIASTLDLAPSALAAPMAMLERAELATSWRNGEKVFYAVNVEGVRRLLSFLSSDCCDGHTDLCRDLRNTAALSAPLRLVCARSDGDYP